MKKRCNKCGSIKPVFEFSKESRSKNGYKPRCKKCLNADYNKNYYKYRNQKLKQAKIYYSENIEKIKANNKKYKPNVDKKKKWREKNIEKVRKWQREYIKNRRKNDPVFKMELTMRTLIQRLLVEKANKTSKMLGYTANELLEKVGNNMDSNKHMDHKVPISWFRKGTDIKIINSLDNLHYISVSENVKKHNKYAHPIPLRFYLIVQNNLKINYLNLS